MHVVLDESALLAAGTGNVLVSRLIHRAHAETGWYLYASVCALVEAGRVRPGTPEHTAAPTPSRPDGAIVATTMPGLWAGQPVRVLDVSSR